jgi:hypothetical protein
MVDLPTLGLPMIAILGGEFTSESSFAAMIKRAIQFESMQLHFSARRGGFPPTEKPMDLLKELGAEGSVVFQAENPIPSN